MSSISINNLHQLNEYCWEIPRDLHGDMLVPARFYSDDKLLNSLFDDRSLEQLINVACLPGIQKATLGMPDMHEGYGFPVGGVASLEYPDGIISPGGIGYDINCGVRLLRSNINYEQAKDHITQIVEELDRQIPAGLGRGGSIKLSFSDLGKVLEKGVSWMVERGYGIDEDLDRIESSGSLKEVDSSTVSDRAKKRGKDQLGTLGSGNHFIEVDRVDRIMDKDKAQAFGLYEGQIVVLMHSGSRGLGHQVAQDYINRMEKAMGRYGVKVPDKQLAGAPFSSPEGSEYFSAMSAAANFAWANRQALTWEARAAWRKVFGKKEELSLVYDVAHNIAKIERHQINENKKRMIVERKGATRAFGPGHEEVPSIYRKAGQPVIIPGSMGTYSYVLAGSASAEDETFASVCHGAGRRLSRKKAMRSADLRQVEKDLQKRGIQVRSSSKKGLLEEIPEAYKDVHNVVDIVHNAGLACKVARLRPVAVVKG